MSEIIEWRGKSYFRSDVPPVRDVGRTARPFDISIKGDFDSTSGELGIVKVAVVNDVERLVMFPPRGGVYDPKNAPIVSRPHYYERDGTGKKYRVFKVQCSVCGDYQRRDAFSPDRRKANGLQSMCKTCNAIRMRFARQTAIAA